MEFQIAVPDSLEDVVTSGDVEAAKADCEAKHPHAAGLRFCVEDGYLGYKPMERPVKFDRIRRITGYLVGTIDRWNDGKRAEEQDRVKHCCTNGCDCCEGD